MNCGRLFISMLTFTGASADVSSLSDYLAFAGK